MGVSPERIALFVGLGLLLPLVAGIGLVVLFTSPRGEYHMGRLRAGILASAVGTALVTVATLGTFATLVTDRNGCLNHWGARASWSASGGCAVRLDNGDYVPEDRIKGESDVGIGITVGDGGHGPLSPGGRG